MVGASLQTIAKSVRVLELPDLPPKGDVVDLAKRGGTVEQLHELIASQAKPWAPRDTTSASEQASKDNSNLFDAARLKQMQFNPIKFVVHGYIVEGLTLFAGKPKVGKSWLLLHAATAVAEGGYTLGNVQCEQGDVLYCALEDNQRRLQSRMTKLFGDSEWPSRLTFTCEMPRLAEGGIEFIKSWIESVKRPRVVIVDTLAMVRMPNRKDTSTYDADYAAVKELRNVALKYGIAIVLVHHLRKAEADDRFDTISGTLGLTGAPDSIMILARDGRGTTLHAKGRDLIEIEKAVKFDPGTCTWLVLGEAGAIRKSAERAAIVKAMEEAGSEALTPNQIAAHCGMKPVNVRNLIAKLLVEDVIEKASYGKYTLKGSKNARAQE
ncbi:MAG: AAA family ATPase [Xanthobacteraceae bacterium]